MYGDLRVLSLNVKPRTYRAHWAKPNFANHTERRLTAQAFVFACESKMTPIGDIGIPGRVLLCSLVNRHNAPYKLTSHE